MLETVNSKPREYRNWRVIRWVRLSKFLIGTRNQGYTAQFFTLSPRTRRNSFSLFVTSVRPEARAWAAIQRPLFPIISPMLSSFGADDAVGLCRFFRQRNSGNHLAHCTQAFPGALALRTRHRSINQFTVSDYRDAGLPRSQLAEAPQNLHRLLVPDTDNDIWHRAGIALPSSGPRAFWGRSFFRSGSSRSSGKPRMRSNAFARHWFFPAGSLRHHAERSRLRSLESGTPSASAR